MLGRIIRAMGLVVASACLLVRPAQAADRQDQLLLTPVRDGTQLTWADTEERLQGEIRPPHPRAGDELRVTLDVGSFEGPAFTGPLRVTLRRPDAAPEVHLVTRERGGWSTRFRLTSPGPHMLDVAFRTTHDKVVHGSFDVDEAAIPIFYAWALLGLAAAGILAYGIRRVVRSRGAEAEGATPP